MLMVREEAKVAVEAMVIVAAAEGTPWGLVKIKLVDDPAAGTVNFNPVATKVTVPQVVLPLP